MLKGFKDSLLSIVYPQDCLSCSGSVDSSDDGIACSVCWDNTRIFNGSEMLCHKCGAFFGDTAAPVPVSCHQCGDHHYDKAAAIGIYEKALSASIISLKTTPVVPQRIKNVIPAAIKHANFTASDVIVPIPLSRQRKLERGFNQAEIVAAVVSKALDIPVDAGSLGRKLHTPIHRMAMDKRARELTVQNAFDVLRPKLIKGKNILLVDDVFTSGATASYCARILKKNGAGSVNVFTLARAVMH